MSKKRTYQADRVERVDVAALLPLLAAGCIVAIDAAKTKFVVALATLAGEVVKLFRFDHPVQTHEFVRVVEALRDGVPAGNVTAAIEPTGTYSDAIRHQLVKARVAVEMVSLKRTHDSRELFDGVPSMHDPKSAMLVAKLCAMGLGRAWIEPPITRVKLRGARVGSRPSRGPAQNAWFSVRGWSSAWDAFGARRRFGYATSPSALRRRTVLFQ